MNRRASAVIWCVCGLACALFFAGRSGSMHAANTLGALGARDTLTGNGQRSVPGLKSPRGTHGFRLLPRVLDPDGNDDDATPISDLSVWEPDDDREVGAANSSASLVPVMAAFVDAWLADDVRWSAAVCHASGRLSASSLESLSVRLQI